MCFFFLFYLLLCFPLSSSPLKSTEALASDCPQVPINLTTLPKALLVVVQEHKTLCPLLSAASYHLPGQELIRFYVHLTRIINLLHPHLSTCYCRSCLPQTEEAQRRWRLRIIVIFAISLPSEIMFNARGNF